MVELQWNFPQTLKRAGITPYALHKRLAAHDVSRTTVYRWSREAPQTLDLALVQLTLNALEQLTGRAYSISDIVEFVPGPGGSQQVQPEHTEPDELKVLLEAAGDSGNIVMPARPGKPRGSANPLPPGPIPSEEYISQEREGRF